MINIKIFYNLLFIFFVIELISCDKNYIIVYPENSFTDKYTNSCQKNEELINDTFTIKEMFYNNTPENIYFSNIKYLDNDNIFQNYPKKNINNEDPTFIKYNSSGCYSWPINITQKCSKFSNYSYFTSITSFEFDKDGNIYILDEGNSECPIKVQKIDKEGKILNTYIIDNNTKDIILSDFVIDTKNNYIYITYSISTNGNDKINDEYGIYVKNMGDTNSATKKVSINYDKLKFDDNYNISNIINTYFENVAKRVINMALSCDSKVLFLSPLSSQKIFSVLTETIISNETTEIKKEQVNEAFKNDFSSSMIAGNLGNLYFTGLEKKTLYRAGQFDNKLTEFDYKGLNQGNGSDLVQGFLPLKLSINNGFLYLNYKNLSSVTENKNFYIRTIIYNATIDKEKSYVYKCAGLNYKWNIITLIIWGIFAFILFFIAIFVFIENRQDKDYDYKKNNEEQILKKKS